FWSWRAADVYRNKFFRGSIAPFRGSSRQPGQFPLRDKLRAITQLGRPLQSAFHPKTLCLPPLIFIRRGGQTLAINVSIEEYESLAVRRQFRIAEVEPDPVRKTPRNRFGPPGLFVEPLFPEVGVVLVGSRLLHGVNQPSSLSPTEFG